MGGKGHTEKDKDYGKGDALVNGVLAVQVESMSFGGGQNAESDNML